MSGGCSAAATAAFIDDADDGAALASIGSVAVIADEAVALRRGGFVPFAEARPLASAGGRRAIHLNAAAPMCVVAIGADAECHTTMAAALAALRRAHAPAPPTCVAFAYSADALAVVQCAAIPRAHVYVSPDFAVQRSAYYARRGVAARGLALQWGTLSASDVRTLLRLGGGGDGCCAAALTVLVAWQRAGAIPPLGAACEALAAACGCRGEGRLGCSVASRVADLRAFVAPAAPPAAVAGAPPAPAVCCVLDPAAVPRGALVVVDLTDPMLNCEFACAVFTVLLAQFRAVADDAPVAPPPPPPAAAAAPALIIALEGVHTMLSGVAHAGGGGGGAQEPLADALMSAARSIHTLPAPPDDGCGGGCDDASVRCALSLLVSTQLPRVLPLDLMDVATLVLLHRMHSRDWLAWIGYKLPLGPGAEGALGALRPAHEEALVYAPHHAVDRARCRDVEGLGENAFRVRLVMPRAHVAVDAAVGPAAAVIAIAPPPPLLLHAPSPLSRWETCSPSDRAAAGSLASASECGASDCGASVGAGWPAGAGAATDMGGLSFGALSSASGGASVCSSDGGASGAARRGEGRSRYSNAPIDLEEFGAEVRRVLRSVGGGPMMCSNLAYCMPERLRPRKGFQARVCGVRGVIMTIGDKTNASFRLSPEALLGEAFLLSGEDDERGGGATSAVLPGVTMGMGGAESASDAPPNDDAVDAVGAALQCAIARVHPRLSHKITGMILALGLPEARAIVADAAKLHEVVAEAVGELERAAAIAGAGSLGAAAAAVVSDAAAY